MSPNCREGSGHAEEFHYKPTGLSLYGSLARLAVWVLELGL